MTRVMKANFDAVRRVNRLTIRCRPQLAERGLRRGHGIKRCLYASRRFFTAPPMPQLPLGFFLLNVRAIGQQHTEQVDAGRRGVDRAAIAEHGEARQ